MIFRDEFGDVPQTKVLNGFAYGLYATICAGMCSLFESKQSVTL